MIQDTQLEFIFADRKRTQFPIVRGILDHSLRLGKISQLTYNAIVMLLDEEDERLVLESEE